MENNNNSFNEEAKHLTATVVDSADYGLDAEQSAMISALCSRSKEGPKSNLETVMRKGASAFMETVYCGYGHSSIGKCGTTKVFTTGQSMLAINLLQNINALYAGQESSTRYITFADENVVMPDVFECDADASKAFNRITTRAMALYNEALAPVKSVLVEEHPVPEDATPNDWDKTLDARTFDICRSLLPGGCKTVGVWDGNLENFRDIVNILNNSENTEVQKLAKEIARSLKERYPSSFDKNFPVSSEWLARSANVIKTSIDCAFEAVLDLSTFDLEGFTVFAREQRFWERGKYDRLSHEVGKFGVVKLVNDIDFGSFRDINRQRKSVTTRSYMQPGTMHEWYLANFNCVPELAVKINALMADVYHTACYLRTKGYPQWAIEYMLPMGSMVRMETAYPIDNAVYVATLRSGDTVHPTARKFAINLAKGLESICNFPIHANMNEEDKLDVKRASQTVGVKSNVVW